MPNERVNCRCRVQRSRTGGSRTAPGTSTIVLNKVKKLVNPLIIKFVSVTTSPGGKSKENFSLKPGATATDHLPSSAYRPCEWPPEIHCSVLNFILNLTPSHNRSYGLCVCVCVVTKWGNFRGRDEMRAPQTQFLCSSVLRSARHFYYLSYLGAFCCYLSEELPYTSGSWMRLKSARCPGLEKRAASPHTAANGRDAGPGGATVLTAPCARCTLLDRSLTFTEIIMSNK